MYAITGITGQVGGAVARKLLSDNQSVCAVIRDAKKGTAWVEQGCAVALADMNDADALTAAFRKAEGVFVVIPPNFAPSPGFLETRAILAALHTAITSGRHANAAAHPGKVVCLSTIGAIVNTSSVLGLVGGAMVPIYTASKHAVEGLTKSVALEFVKQGIRVNAVSPGPIQTEMLNRLFKANPKATEDFIKGQPMGRIGTPSEVVNAVLWLCSDASSFVTGQSLTVDGGFIVQ